MFCGLQLNSVPSFSWLSAYSSQLILILCDFRLDADESWSVSANEWGLFTRYFDAPDCVKTLVQWAEEKCAAASNKSILKHPDSESVKALLEEVFAKLRDTKADKELSFAASDDSVDTPVNGQRKLLANEIEEVAGFLRMHLFVKVAHLRA